MKRYFGASKNLIMLAETRESIPEKAGNSLDIFTDG